MSNPESPVQRTEAEYELALREASQFCRQVVDCADAGIIVYGPDLTYRIWNPYMEKLSGVNAQEVVGRHPLQLFPFLAQHGVMERLELALAGHAPEPIDVPFHLPSSGRSGWVTDTSAPLRNAAGEIIGVIATVRDITERKRAEESLRQARDHYLKLLEDFPCPVWRSGADGKCDYFNITWLQFTGRTLEQEMGDGWVEGVHPDDRDRCFQTYLEAFQNRQPFQMEYRLLHHDGTYHWLSDYGAPYSLQGGEFGGYIGSCHDITPQKVMDALLLESHAELEQWVEERTRELRKSHELLHCLSRQVPGGIYQFQMLPDGRSCLPYASDALVEMFEVTAEEIIDDASAVFTRIHPDDTAAVVAAIDRSAERLAPYYYEFRVVLPRKGLRWYTADARPQRLENGGVLWNGFVTDMTDRKRMEEALRESEVRFRQIFEQSEDAIIFFKPGTCTIIDANSTAERLYGYSKAELRGGGLELLVRPQDFLRMSRIISSVSHDDMTDLDNIVNVRKDGSELIVSMRGKVMVLQGTDIIYCTFRDISERIMMEEEARSIQAKLIQTNKMTSLGLLVSGVAHEINNPNNFILANAEFLDRSWEDALKLLREYFRENGEFFIGGIPFSQLEASSPRLFAGISDGARRINEIINNLKKFSRQDMFVPERNVDINEVATSAVSILHYELSKFTENFQLDLDHTVPLVRGSSQQLGQVIINLLMNACQALATKHHGIRLTTRFDPASNHVTISVRDEGSGMSREDGNRILEPFFTTKLDQGGTGLGLSICSSILREHNGLLEFESEPGKGTTFIVKIPAVDPAAQERSP